MVHMDTTDCTNMHVPKDRPSPGLATLCLHGENHTPPSYLLDVLVLLQYQVHLELLSSDGVVRVTLFQKLKHLLLVLSSRWYLAARPRGVRWGGRTGLSVRFRRGGSPPLQRRRRSLQFSDFNTRYIWFAFCLTGFCQFLSHSQNEYHIVYMYMKVQKV